MNSEFAYIYNRASQKTCSIGLEHHGFHILGLDVSSGNVDNGDALLKSRKYRGRVAPKGA
jgi:hypothetical protein